MKKTIFILTGFMIACGSKTVDDPAFDCDTPIAEAGEDISVSLGSAVTLNGAESSWCASMNEEAIFNWSFVATPADSSVTDQNFSDNRSLQASNPKFVPDVAGDYVASLVIDLGDYTSSEDYVIVSVSAGGTAPIADCGKTSENSQAEYIGKIGEVITLDGSDSYDSDGNIRKYEWSLTAPACSSLTTHSLYNADTAHPSFVPDCNGIFVAGLVVSDGGQDSEPVLCSIDVANENRLPVANAGSSKTFSNCVAEEIQLNGSGSYDLDGDPLTYTWEIIEVPEDSTIDSSALSNIHAVSPFFTYDVPGSYVFQLQVADPFSASAPDLVSIVIKPDEENSPPVADAGGDQEVDLRVNCDSSSYSSGCVPCSETKIFLDGTASYDADGDNLHFLWTSINDALPIADPTSPIIEVTIPTLVLSSSSQVISTSYEFSLEVYDCDRNRNHIETISIDYSCQESD